MHNAHVANPSLVITSSVFPGTLNFQDLVLTWEGINPLEINNFIMPEYNMKSYDTRYALTCYTDEFPSPRMGGVPFATQPRQFCEPFSTGSKRILKTRGVRRLFSTVPA